MTGFSVNYQNNISGVDFNDLYLDAQGNLALNSGITEVEENCFHAVQLCVGDYDYNTTLGIPYDAYLSSDSPVGNQLKLSLAKSLLAVDGVVSIESMDLALNPVTRVLQITIIVNLTTGAQITITL